jgi:hypothetical protein
LIRRRGVRLIAGGSTKRQTGNRQAFPMPAGLFNAH